MKAFTVVPYNPFENSQACLRYGTEMRDVNELSLLARKRSSRPSHYRKINRLIVVTAAPTELPKQMVRHSVPNPSALVDGSTTGRRPVSRLGTICATTRLSRWPRGPGRIPNVEPGQLAAKAIAWVMFAGRRCNGPAIEVGIAAFVDITPAACS